MDPIALLETDHRQMKQLLAEGEKATDKAEKQAIFNRVRLELAVHEVIEEELFYPACRAHPKAKELVLEGLEEHHVVDDLMGELTAMRPENEVWDAKFDVMRENVEHHMDEEEKDLFPKVRELFGKRELEKLGDEMGRRKAEAHAEMERIAPAP